MKIPIDAALKTASSAVKKHGPKVLDLAVDKAGKEIKKWIMRKLKMRR